MTTPIEIGFAPSPMVLTDGTTAIMKIVTRDIRKIPTDSLAENGSCSLRVVFDVSAMLFLNSGSCILS